ncbi:MAG: hypothetical protein IPP81_08965 [Chitinophagaceae bacterium]|nr:hypothetical protein [Chitinophagaceae bacterium]
MKYFCKTLLLCSFLNSHAQKDKTLSWVLPQHEDTRVIINSKSFPINQYFYAEHLIAPTAAKTLNIKAYARLSSVAQNLFSTTYAPFNLQVKTRRGDLLNQIYMDGTAFVNIPLKNTDTVALIFVANPPANDSIDIAFDYIIADTAALIYSNANPEETFNKMLEMAGTGYINMYDNAATNLYAIINYPDGLFASGPAERKRHRNELVQYTGEKLNRQAANKNTAEWNLKIKKWLADYNISDIKKTVKGDEQLNTDEEETVYIKKNAQGFQLFRVTVFKQVVGAGTEAEPMSYTTGVLITH